MIRGIAPWLALSLLAALPVFAGCYVYFAHAPALVAAQDNSVGEMLLDEALRYPSQRREKLELALYARFQGMKNQRHLYLELAKDNPAERERWLRQALEDDALAEKSPVLWREAQVLLSQTLLEQGRPAELAVTLDVWEAKTAPPSAVVLRTAEDLAWIARFRKALN